MSPWLNLTSLSIVAMLYAFVSVLFEMPSTELGTSQMPKMAAQPQTSQSLSFHFFDEIKGAVLGSF